MRLLRNPEVRIPLFAGIAISVGAVILILHFLKQETDLQTARFRL